MTIIKLCFASILPDPAALLDELSSKKNTLETTVQSKALKPCGKKHYLRHDKKNKTITQSD
jgi:hypothetical protein